MFRSTRTGTVFVTASNSDERSRTETDFLCDGTADDAEIQAAVDSLPSGGGMVVLSEGTFTLTATISRSIDNITIMGMGKSTRLVNNGSTKLISDGAQAGWAFLEFDVDAGDVTASGTGVVSDYWLNGVRQDTSPTLTTEEVQDIAGALIDTGGTKTGIAITYQDSTDDIDFVVDHDGGINFASGEHFTMLDEDDLVSDSNTQAATQQSIKAYIAANTGTGDVAGDTASIDKELVRFNSTTGKIIESPRTDNSSITATLSDDADLILYNSANDGNPEFTIGADSLEHFRIIPIYDGGTGDLDYVSISSSTASAVANRGELRFNVDGTERLVLNDNGLKLQITDGIIDRIAELKFDERADHISTPAGGEGYLWVKSDNPSSLIYTDDAGTDVDISTGLQAAAGFHTYTYVIDANASDDTGQTVTLAGGSTYILYQAVQTAITAGDALATDVSIFITAGTYNEDIVIPASANTVAWTFHGQGMDLTFIGTAAANTNKAFENLEGSTTGLTIKDLTLRGGTSSGFSAYALLRSDNTVFENVKFLQSCLMEANGALYTGCIFEGGYNTDNNAAINPRFVFLTDCTFTNSVDSLWDGLLLNHHFNNCQWESGAGIVVVRSCVEIFFTNCDFGSNNAASGKFNFHYNVNQLLEVTFIGCTFQSPDTTNGIIYIQECSSNSFLTVIGCKFHQQGTELHPMISSDDTDLALILIGNSFDTVSAVYPIIEGSYSNSTFGANFPTDYDIDIVAGSNNVYYGTQMEITGALNTIQQRRNPLTHPTLEDDFFYENMADATMWRTLSGTAASDPEIPNTPARMGTLTGSTGSGSSFVFADDGVLVVGETPWRIEHNNLVFEARVSFSNNIGMQICLGMTDTQAFELPATISGTTITTNLSNGVLFVYDTNATTDEWYGVGVKANTDATGNGITGIQHIGSTYMTFRIEIISDSSARLYINDLLEITLTANICTKSTELFPVLAMTSDTETHNFHLDYIRVSSGRRGSSN